MKWRRMALAWRKFWRSHSPPSIAPIDPISGPNFGYGFPISDPMSELPPGRLKKCAELRNPYPRLWFGKRAGNFRPHRHRWTEGAWNFAATLAPGAGRLASPRHPLGPEIPPTGWKSPYPASGPEMPLLARRRPSCGGRWAFSAILRKLWKYAPISPNCFYLRNITNRLRYGESHSGWARQITNVAESLFLIKFSHIQDTPPLVAPTLPM